MNTVEAILVAPSLKWHVETSNARVTNGCRKLQRR